jgi:alkylation response protein AidB-like acyl-CoA dehydrogenase
VGVFELWTARPWRYRYARPGAGLDEDRSPNGRVTNVDARTAPGAWKEISAMSDVLVREDNREESASVTREERQMLLDAVRGLLDDKWPPLGAVQRAGDEAAVRTIYRQLAELGLGGLGRDPALGGLQEILLVVEELGRAACPAPLWATSLVNILLAPVAAADSVVEALLARIETGEAAPALAFGPLDGDRTAGAASLRDGRISGEFRYLDGAAGVDVLVAALTPTSVAIVEVQAGGTQITTTRAVGGTGLVTAKFIDAPAHVVDLPAGALADVVLMGRLATTARAYGAANRANEMVVEYAKERRQFGRPIGNFQAIQHKLANSYISLETVKRSADLAGSEYDRGSPDWRVLASGVIAFAGSTLRQVSIETHHTFGAIGYAEDHEAPRHFRRVHQDVLRLGGARRSREDLAAYFLDAGNGFPEIYLGARGNRFRDEVKAWFDTHWPRARSEEFWNHNRPHHYDRDFARELGKTGWLGLNWSKKFGGQERSPMENLAFLQESARAEAPRAGSQVQAVGWMMFGRPDQQEKYLPPLLAGEAFYGMWYSEPGAGSDLGSLQTRAVRDGDSYVINGQKIWTTSFYSDYMWLAARTDPDATPQQAGVTIFCVPTDTPGFSMTRIENMYDGEFAQTFFDDMRVPADYVVGRENQGWQVLMAALGTERGIAGAHLVLEAAHLFELVCDHIRSAEGPDGPLKDDPITRDTIGRLAAELFVGRALALHCFDVAGQGETPLYLAAATKIFSSELIERMCEALLDLVGMEGALSRHADGAILGGRIEQRLRNSLMYVISMGTNEIQRNLIAHRGLGLPR